MTNDEPFRTIVAWALVVLLPIMLTFRIRAHHKGERLDRMQEGKFILFTLRPLALVAVVGFITFLVSPQSMAWSSLPLPRSVRWAGIALGVLGVVSLFWTLVSLGRNLTDTVVTRKNATLVTHGPYRFVRHPFYGSITLFFLANSLATANWFITLCWIGVMALLVVRTDREEEQLVAKFGDAYRNYMARTGRFFPRF